jgi:signal transduction histidine kinase
VGKNEEEATPKLLQNQIFFEPSQETVEIVIQVSNYSFRESGIFGDVTYGDSEALIPSVMKDLSKDIVLISGFLVIGLYHLIIYITKRKELSNLFIGCAGIAFAVRILLLSEFLAFSLFPAVSWELIVRIEYLMEAIGFVFLILLMKHMYPREVHRYVFHLACGFVVVFIGYILLTPVRVFTETLLLNVTIMAFILLYFVFYVGILAALRKREGARINLFAIFVIILAMGNDTLYYAQMVDTTPVMDYCVLLFILFQAVIVSYRYALVFQKNQGLTAELVQTNNTLEEKVKDRTKELHEKNEQLAQLQNMRTKRLANIAHDLGSPMIGIQTYLQLMKEGIIQAGNQDFVQQLFGKSNDMKRLIDDLFELTKLESKELSLVYEDVRVNRFVQDVYHKFEPDLSHVNMQLQLGRIETSCMGKEASIRIDPFRIMQVLQNYIGNAVKFSESLGTLLTINCYIVEWPYTDNERYGMCFEVVDHGVGIAEEELPQVFQRFYKKKEGNANGSGLGLAISKEIIELHGGNAGVTSTLGKGSTFYFILPVVVDIESLQGDS